jgi:hypothetical protein
MPTTAARRFAVLTAAAIEVTCPACGEPQPNPNDGSHLWRPDEVRDASGTRRACVACDAPIVIQAVRRIAVEG